MRNHPFQRASGQRSLAALVTLGLAVLMLAGTVAYAAIGQRYTVSDGFLHEGNLWRGGNLLASFTYIKPGDTPEKCMETCKANPDCEAFSYVRPKKQLESLRCYHRLWSNPHRAARNYPRFAQIISGLKLSQFPDKMRVNLHRDTVLVGSTMISSSRVANGKSGGLCLQYSSVGRKTNRQGFFSGASFAADTKPITLPMNSARKAARS